MKDSKIKKGVMIGSDAKGFPASSKESFISMLSGGDRDKYESIIRRGYDHMKKGFSCFGESPTDELLRSGASKIEPKENYFDVAMHGSQTEVCFGGNEPNMDPRTLANLIKHHPDYNGENIRLFCCNTGNINGLQGEYCFAEELSNNLGVIVEAPDDLVYIRSNGTWYVEIPTKKELRQFRPNQRGRFK